MKYLRHSIVLFFLFTSGSCVAQTFRSRAELGTVRKTGFYIIPVTQSLAAKCKTDLADVRVADEKGTWIPHIIKETSAEPAGDGYLAFPMQLEAGNSSVYTLIRADNSSGLLISNLVLQLKNADVDRKASLSGSYDGKNWFIVSESLRLQPAEATTGSNHAQQLSFSPSDYKFFRISINNRKTDPLLITGIGTRLAANTVAGKKTVEWNAPAFCKQEEQGAGITLVTITAPVAAHINGIAVEVAAPQLYQRDVTVFVIEPADSLVGQKIPVDRFTLQSGEQSVRIAAVKARQLYLSIENKDNPPLRIKGVQTFTDKHYLITWLEADKPYFLLAGNQAVTAAAYDLEKFRNQLQPIKDTLTIGTFEAITVKTMPSKKSNQSPWLWPAIAVGLAGLGFLTWRLMGDMKKKGM